VCTTPRLRKIAQVAQDAPYMKTLLHWDSEADIEQIVRTTAKELQLELDDQDCALVVYHLRSGK
jgi:hypothetical protein